MHRFTVELTADQIREIDRQLTQSIQGLDRLIEKYTNCPTPEDAMHSGKYGSWFEYEYQSLDNYKRRRAFLWRLRNEITDQLAKRQASKQ